SFRLFDGEWAQEPIVHFFGHRPLHRAPPPNLQFNDRPILARWSAFTLRESSIAARGRLQRFDTYHGLPWDGPAPVPRYNGVKDVPGPSVGFSGRRHLPTTMRAQAPGPCPRRTMYALLSRTTPILLWRRSACQEHVSVHPRPGRPGRLRPEPAGDQPGVLASDRTVSQRAGRRRRVSVLLVLARRPVC